MLLEPDIEARPWEDRVYLDDTDYRRQIGYLLDHSRFYREKLGAAGVRTPDDAGGLAEIDRLRFTEKDELRASRSESDPIGTHLCVDFRALARIFSTSGTTGTPSYVPLTAEDHADWVRISSRSYAASGVRRGDRLVSTYGAGPFVAGVTLDTFNALGLTHIPVGAGNTDRLLAAVQLLHADTIAMTPSYAAHIAEKAAERGIDLASSSVRRLLVAGEPGGGEPALRAHIESAWAADVTEAMGIGDIAVSLWGECPEKNGMHFSGQGFVHVELIDPANGNPVAMTEGAEGELVYTHLRHRAAPLLRFRSRDHVVVHVGRCPCGRTAPRVRCIGRTDDMLIVRGVNLFPTALREIVNEFHPVASGFISIRPARKGPRQDPPLRLLVELGEVGDATGLADRIRERVREALLVATDVALVPHGSLPRSTYKSHLVDWTEAKA
jgi:phenylacetate-CoA ligase